MNNETAVSNAKDIADRILAPGARQHDKEARFSSAAIAALGPAGLLALMLPTDVGGAGLRPKTLAAVVATIVEAGASAAMVYLMHQCALRSSGPDAWRKPADASRAACDDADLNRRAAARIYGPVDHPERARETTMLRVLESKAAAGEVAIAVTSAAMRVCGGAAFSKHLAIERVFRDAHAGAVMAPTGDLLGDFMARQF